MAISALSLGNGYFIDPKYCIVELEHQFENFYEIVTTGLLNFGMPLIRYKLGDLVQVLDRDNPYNFEHIDGRIDDVIITAEGKRIGRLDPVFKGVEGIDFAQIVQESLNRITVNIVLTEGVHTSFNSETFIENLKSRTSKTMHIEIKYVNEIPRSANGKFKSVISNLKTTPYTN
jgi:phenylacetate-CoA ligase